MRAMTSRMSIGLRKSSGITPASSSQGYSGSSEGSASIELAGPLAPHFSCASSSRAMRNASASSSARYSPRPDTDVCISAPPSSSSVAISPVAALSSGGPARKALARPRTMIT